MTRYILLVIWAYLLFNSFPLQGQAPVDSLKNLVWQHPEPDSQQTAWINAIAEKSIYNHPDTALFYALWAEKLADSLHQPGLLIQAKLNLARYYYSTPLPDYAKATQKVIEAFKLCEGKTSREFERYKAGIHIRASAIAMLQGEFDKALEHVRIAQQLAKKWNDPEVLADAYIACAFLFTTGEKVAPDSAEYYLKNALPLFTSHSFPYDKAFRFWAQWGKFQSLKGNAPEGERAFKKALKLVEDNRDTTFIITVLLDLGMFYQITGEPEKALAIYRKTSTFPLGTTRYKANLFQQIAQTYASMQRYDSAFHYQFLYTQEREKELEIEKEKQVRELEVQYQTQQMQSENQALRLRNQLFLSLALALLLLFLAGGIYLYFLQKTKRLTEREHQNFKRFTEEKEKLTGLLLHDLRTPLTTLQFGLFRLKNLLKQGLMPEPESLTPLGEALESINTLSANALKTEMLESFHPYCEIQEVDCKKILQEALAELQPLIAFKQLQLQLEMPESSLKIRGHVTQVQRIFSNLLLNAIKYTPVGSNIRTGLAIEEGHVRFWVTDEGAGLSPEEQQVIFEKGKKLEQPDAESGPSLGYGLYFVKEYIRQLNGRLELESEKGKGSTFRVWFDR